MRTEKYLVREERLDTHPWSRRALISWVLTKCEHSAGPITPEAVLSSCETYCEECTWKGRTGTVYGIASVFTSPDCRKKGYAGELIRLLVDKVRRMDSDALALVLYSDVGASMYEQAGSFSAPVAQPMDYVATLKDDANAVSQVRDACSGVQWLRREDVRPYIEEINAAAARESEATSLIIKADPLQVDWLIERQASYEDLMSFPHMQYSGAVLGGSCAVWMHDIESGTLRILLCQVDNAETGAAVFAAAVKTAMEAGIELGKTITWSVVGWPWPLPQDACSNYGLRLEAVSRKGSLPMIVPLCEGLNPQDWIYVPRAIWQ
eukprot:jgi/Chlat1/6678/Chrsp49S06165